ncbi:MAG: hypothetical protein KKA73_25635 [Chloroflexi bacterium]|nr:hypothetical protein [Chloroflexota bacterium]MBU1751080.1 hypothetical protein [Chloroflexota bacterium]
MRLLGLALIATGLLILLLGGLWLAVQTVEQGGKLSTAVFGLALIAVLLTLPCLIIGVLLLRHGQAQDRDLLQVEQEKRLLTAVLTRGEVSISDLSIEMDQPREQIQDYVYDLVGKGLFTGYVDWKRGVLYAREVADMPQNACPSCGGPRGLVGKGVVRCEYCGAETFL